jgi:DNA polymerase-3 subunit gamma/tau
LHVSLYRKYRPKFFSEVVGQDAAVDLLRSSFARGRLGHAYLFSGPRGCGKTTAARLLAKVVNCQNPTEDGEPCCACDSCVAVASGEHMDVMEIDGASNRGIEAIRELKSHVGLTSFMGGMKVYILDEVHMLTMEAFNALLKTLEEPPPSVMFIFATTEPHKVPVTIRSRCQHIPFHRISTEQMAAQLSRIAASEGLNAESAALWEIARNADGALRDAISLFEQAVSLGHGEVGVSSALALFGGGRSGMERWVSAVRERSDEASPMLKSMLDQGMSPERFLDGLFPLLRDMWAFSLWGEKSFAGTSLSDEEKKFLREEVPNWAPLPLKRSVACCAALFPKARLGLRGDVFCGLLMFEMMSVFEPDAPQEARQAPPVAGSALPARRQAAFREEGTAEIPPPEPPAARAPSAIPSDLPDVMSALMKEGLPIAAAMINVKAFLDDDGLDFDYSEATGAAEAMLKLPRSRAALERVFGVASKETEDGSASENEGGKDRPASGARDARSAAATTAEAISERIGADLLMSKRLVSDDTDTDAGGVDDEQL